ncbi:MAG: molybdopterin-guanine dinucleotide biosynthesis protein B [Gemmatimonadetes bacterium]|nr:molybdopterin-guanine dinucleotide biosynthesis protein B [Gemmatimonadota bacterium]
MIPLEIARERIRAWQRLIATLSAGGGELAPDMAVEAMADREVLWGRTLRLAAPLPPVASIRGPSNSGKTRLIEQLLPVLSARGVRVGTIKRAHHTPALDTPGKDSHRHAAAGARGVLLLGPQQAGFFLYDAPGAEPWPWLELLAGRVDIVLAEGSWSGAVLRLEIQIRDAGGFALLEPADCCCGAWTLRRPAATGQLLDFPEELVERLAGLLQQLTTPSTQANA